MPLLDAKEFACVAAKNHRALLRGKVQTVEKTHRLLVTHIEAVIASEYQSVYADVLHQIVEYRAGMRNCVITEAP